MNHLTTRREFVKTLSMLPVASSVLCSTAFVAKTQIPRIGYLGGKGSLKMEDVFIDELAKLGLKEGENIHIEMRLALPNTSETATMAAELAKMDLLLVVAAALPQALEIRKNNPKMPMVIGTCPDMVSNGFAKTLAHPGGIYTGLDELPEGVTAKRLQLLHAVAPGANRIALLSTTPGIGGHEKQLADAEKTAAAFGINVKAYRAKSQQELETALTDLVSDGRNGLLNFQGALSLYNREKIAALAAQHRIPAIYQATAFAEAGGLMAWAPDLPQQFRETAHYVDKILKGVKPGDLSAKHPDKYYLTLNQAAAAKIGITFPKELLAEANKVIE
ncbi:MAG: ABC transporter substrate-binding protein [Cytophagales bacterium]|nr:ABC transporter substrate-binding protein [Cytophagales bacterium]